VKIGVLTTRLFDPPSSGGERCTARLLQALQEQGHRLHVAGLGAAPASTSRIRFETLGPAPQPFALWPRAARGAHLLQAWLAMEASTTLRARGHGATRRQVTQLLARWHRAGIDALIVDHLHAFAWLAQARHTLPPPVLVMHNLESHSYAEQAARVGGAKRWFLLREACLLRRLEHEALAACSAVLALSEADRSQLAAAAGAAGSRAQVLTLPGYPAENPSHSGSDWRSDPRSNPESNLRSERVTARPPGPRRVGLIGTWTWEPNRRALDWLLSHVVPALPPGIEVWVAGAGAQAKAGSPAHQHPAVRWLGWVPNAEGFYAQLDWVAVPSVEGSGVQEKAIEAIGVGKPVVATPHALRGLGPDLPAHVHVAQDARHFAGLITEWSAAAQSAAEAQAAQQAAQHSARLWAARRRKAYVAVLGHALHNDRTLGHLPAAPSSTANGSVACVQKLPLS
jgi:polysaccharide biosynthesis protein PslH